MQTIELELTVDETNQILQALGALPFSEVFELINKIQTQAQVSLQKAEAADTEPSSDESEETH